VRDIIRSQVLDITDLEMQANATDTLHEAAEAMMVLSALHANRVTVTLDDLHSLQRLKRPDIRTTKGPPPQALGAVVRAKQLEERTSRGPGDSWTRRCVLCRTKKTSSYIRQ